MIILLKSVLGVFAAVYSLFFSLDFLKNRRDLSKASWLALAETGFVTNFLDTLGVGSFAKQRAIFKLFKLIDDRIIPETLNIGNTLPTVFQAFIFMTVVEATPLTLASIAIAAPIGEALGAGVVSRWPRHKVGLGIALLAVGLAILAGLLNWFPREARRRGSLAGNSFWQVS